MIDILQKCHPVVSETPCWVIVFSCGPASVQYIYITFSSILCTSFRKLNSDAYNSLYTLNLFQISKLDQNHRFVLIVKSSGVSDQVRLKLACSATEAS